MIRLPAVLQRVYGRLPDLWPLPATGALPSTLPDLPALLDMPGLVARPSAIAFFGYSITGYEGETTSQEDIFEVSPASGAVRRITDHRDLPVMRSDRDPAWSPDGSRLAIHAASTSDPTATLYLISRSAGVVVQALVDGHSPCWLNSNTLLFLDTVAAGTDEAHDEAFCVSRSTLAVTRLTDLGVGVDVTGLSWHPSGGLALAVSEPAADRSGIAVVPAAAIGAARAPSGTPIARSGLTMVTPPGLHAAAPDWSPDAARLALTTWQAGQPSRVGHWSVPSATLTTLPGPAVEPELSDHGAVFSPDGASIAFARGLEDAWSEIWIYRLRGRRMRQLTDDSRQRFKGGLDWATVRRPWLPTVFR